MVETCTENVSQRSEASSKIEDTGDESHCE